MYRGKKFDIMRSPTIIAIRIHNNEYIALACRCFTDEIELIVMINRCVFAVPLAEGVFLHASVSRVMLPMSSSGDDTR